MIYSASSKKNYHLLNISSNENGIHESIKHYFLFINHQKTYQSFKLKIQSKGKLNFHIKRTSNIEERKEKPLCKKYISPLRKNSEENSFYLSLSLSLVHKSKKK